MAATQLLAVGDTLANSAEFTVVAGTPVTVALKGAKATATVRIQIKDDAGAFQDVGAITAGGAAMQSQFFGSAAVISGPGTYRLQRQAGATCGAFSG